MRELSIFIDESGDFGPMQKHSPFYILSVVLHDQSHDIARYVDSLFQAADLCCTLALLRQKMATTGLSNSERDFFSTPKSSAERALKKGYFKTMDHQRFGT